MSLLGSRGRFTQDENEFFKNTDLENKSALSSIGKNPISTFLMKKDETNVGFDLKEKLKTADIDKYQDEEVKPDHQKYNEKLHKFNLNFEKRDKKQKEINGFKEKKKISLKTIIAMVIVEVFTLFGIYMIGSIYRYTKMTQPIPFTIENVKNTEITESTLELMKGYKTVAIFGVDSRTGSIDKGNNADVNLIINLNMESGDVQLVSVYRDFYLSITDNNLYDKLNAAYRRGGPEQAVKALNKNLDLNIDSYFAFNWKAVADGIELLGGIDLEISKSEYRYMNAFIHETCIATGIDAKNPAAHYIKSDGMQHLDGVQAVAYGRLRLMDSDFQRVERQKKVISLCLEKAKQIDIPKLRLIMEAVLPQIAYSFDMNEMISLLRIVRAVNITESTGCPDVNNLVLMQMGSSGDCVVPLNLEKAVVKLHKILFNVDDYTPSAAVKRYSNRIRELRTQHTEENRINESIKESQIAESIEKTNTNANTNKPVIKKSTSSDTTKSKETTEKSINTPPIDNSNDYEEEPEENNNLPIYNNTTESTTIVINKEPGGTSQVAPPSNVPSYNSPGVPSNSNNVIVTPGGPPGSSNNSSGGVVVVPGPPTGNSAISNNGPSQPIGNGANNSMDMVPILTAPY